MAIFKVMTWNVENLFSLGNNFSPKTEAEYTEKLNSLASVILTLDPDVLAVQEVGDLKAFTELLALLEGRYPHTCLSAFPDPRGIRVGFFSKIAIAEQEDIINFPEGGFSKVISQDTEGNLTEVNRMGRGALRILVKPQENISIHIINAHFKSKLLTFSSTNNNPRFAPKDENERSLVAGLALIKRTAEAVALRVKANKLLENNANQGLIVLGDLNDVPSAATTQILHGPSGSEIGTRGFNLLDKGDDTRLFNLAPLIDEKRRYSRIFQNNKELIDHIFVSQELLPGQPRKLPQVDSYIDAMDSLPSVSDDPNLRRGKPGSDHAPIIAVFDL
ncbi:MULTISPECIES: endonuclease/exonuclease/phosphatase family protein [Nostoc]|uniref:Endonuclease/exonuclease/phosphatase family protein n=1 Tax=Nostoc paludosum FACHB-159 TaxID=2692908 RepID=A0ABR8K375_9NOSO|nr:MULTISPECIES: endonuclease/exonuclease/phosphatase family protein [Nostoc]MBD2677024.1 endonuclease/exonuclease/phosphatase family protein [Nostoc sp. FACHB-857]MBD2733224.1 endonuclease/exonuclease/phosphatase family protein [Nostoc paludosum FACHB-159]